MKSYDNFSWLNMREMEPIVKHTDPGKSEKKAATEPAGKSLPEGGAKTMEAGKTAAEPQTKKPAGNSVLKKPQNTEHMGNQGKPAEVKRETIPSNAREIEKKETVTRDVGDVPAASSEGKKENLKKEDLSKNENQKVTLPQSNTMPEAKKNAQAKTLYQGKKASVTPTAIDKTDEAKSRTDVSPNKNGSAHKQHTKTGTSPIPAIRVGTGNTSQVAAKPLSGVAGMQPGKAKSVGSGETEKSSGQKSDPAKTEASKSASESKKDKNPGVKATVAGFQKGLTNPSLAPSSVKTYELENKTPSDKIKNEQKDSLFDTGKGVTPKPERGNRDSNQDKANSGIPEEKPADNPPDDVNPHKQRQDNRTSGRKMPVKITVIAAVAAVAVILAGVLVVPRFFHKGSEDVVTAEENETVTGDTVEDDELDGTQITETQELETETTDEVETTELDEEEEKIYGLLSSFWLSNVNTSMWTDWPQATNESEESVIVFIRVTSPMEMFRERDADGNLAEFEMEEDIYLFLQNEDDRDSATESHFDENWVELTEVSREVVEFSGNNEGKGYTYVFAYHCPLGTGESSTTLFDTFRIKSGISSTIDDGENESIKVQVLAVPVSEVKRLISGADTTGEISEANLTEYYKYFYETAG